MEVDKWFLPGKTRKKGNNDTKDVDIMVQLKCFRNFWRLLEMSLINCNSNLILT